MRRANLPLSVVWDVYTNQKLTVKKFIQKNAEYRDLQFLDKQWISNIKQPITSEGLVDTLAGYIVRMGSRATHYQSLGMIGSKNVDKETYLFKPNVKWIRELTKLILILQPVNSQILISINQAVYKKEGEFFLNYDSSCQAHISEKSPLGTCLEWLIVNQRVTFSSFQKFTKRLFSDYINDWQAIIKEMIKKDLIVCQLEPKSLNSNLIENDFSILKSKFIPKQLRVKVNNILFLFKALDDSSPQLDVIREIRKSMNSIVNVGIDPIYIQHLIPIDKVNYFPLNIGKKLKMFYSMLSVLTPAYREGRKLKAYMLTQTGMYQELDFFKGISAHNESANYKFKIDKTYEECMRNYKEKLNRVLTSNNGNHIMFDDDDIDTLMKTLAKAVDHTAPKANFDFLFNMYKVHEQNFFYIPTSGFQAEGSFFNKIKNDETITRRKPYFPEIEYLSHYLPEIGRQSLVTNRMIQVNGYNTLIKNKLDLKQVCFVVDKSGLHLEEKGKALKLFPMKTSLIELHYQKESGTAAFLEDIGNYLIQKPTNLFIPNYYEYTHLPRIQYKNVILLKEMWNFKINESYKLLKMKKKLMKFIQENRIPLKVSVMEDGNEFPVCLNSKFGIKTVLKILRKHLGITFIEILNEANSYHFDFKGSISCGNENFEKKVSDATPEIRVKSREFKSVYILLKNKRDEEIILKKLAESLNDKKYFFVRYYESGIPSIRLRINTTSSDLALLVSRIEAMTKYVKGVQVQYYYPEIVRYGGETLLKEVEKLFVVQSHCYLRYKMASQGQNKEVFEKAFMVALLINNQKNTSLAVLLKKFLKNYESNKRLKEQNLNNEKEFVKLCIIIQNMDWFRNIKIKINALSNSSIKKLSVNRSEYLVSSVLHMTFNRFIGTDSKKEQKMYQFVASLFKNEAIIDALRD